MPAEEVEKIVWLGESLGFWIQTVAFFLSALGAIFVIKANGKQARMRATIDLMLQQKHDTELADARKLVLALHNSSEIMARYLADPTSNEYKAIQITLNNYEFIASGIRESAFDELIYKRTRYNAVIKDWYAFKGIISEIRRLHGNTRFQEFEWLCCKWLESPLNGKRWWNFFS